MLSFAPKHWTLALRFNHIAAVCHYKGQSNLATGNIAQFIMTSGTAHICLTDIFYHIREVAARITKLVMEGCIWDPHFRCCRVRKSDVVASYRLSIVTIVLSLTIRPQFSTETLRCSNQQGVGHFEAKFGRKRLTNVRQILTWCGKYMRLSYAKEIMCHFSTMRERDRQTNKQTTER